MCKGELNRMMDSLKLERKTPCIKLGLMKGGGAAQSQFDCEENIPIRACKNVINAKCLCMTYCMISVPGQVPSQYPTQLPLKMHTFSQTQLIKSLWKPKCGIHVL